MTKNMPIGKARLKIFPKGIFSKNIRLISTTKIADSLSCLVFLNRSSISCMGKSELPRGDLYTADRIKIFLVFKNNFYSNTLNVYIIFV